MAANLFCTTANSNENAKENGAFTVSKMINQNTPNNDKYNIGKRVDGKEPGKVTRVYLQVAFGKVASPGAKNHRKVGKFAQDKEKLFEEKSNEE